MHFATRRFTKLRILWACCALMLALGLGLSVTSAQAQSTDLDPAEANVETGTSALNSLLEVLQNDTARARLIEELEATLIAADEAATTVIEPVEEGVSLGRRIALMTQEVGQEAVATLSGIWSSLSSGQSVFSGLSGDEFNILLEALPDLLLVIGITVSVFLVLRTLAKRFYARLGQSAERAGFFRTASLFLVSNVTDLLIVLLAWTLGYLVTILAVGEFGSIGIGQTMYLNAFLLVEVGKVVVRTVLSPAASGLRMVNVTDHAAITINRSLSLVISVLGYGQLLVVPIVNRSASMAAGSGVSALLSLFVLLYLVYVVIRRREGVANWLSSPVDTQSQPDTEADEIAFTSNPGRANGLMVGLAKLWHWIVLAYLSAMFVVVMTQPADMTFNALLASGKVLAALIVASLVSGWLSSAMVRGVTLPEDINKKLPLLQPRLNRFVPRAFGMLRLFILTVVLLFSLDVIGMIDMRAWLVSQVGLQVTTSIISVTMILLVAFGLWLALTSFVDYRLNPEYGAVPTSRETTLLTLLRNAATIALVIITLMFCLSEIGLNIGPLLASAGVLGLAIGFGAQSMVKDIITGVFIQFENAINVGDVITVGGITGTVEKLSVRSVSLRDGHGVFHIIPFSSVNMVSNAMREFSYSVCEMGIAYRENVEDAKQAMHDAFDMMMEDPAMAEFITAPLEWFGINSFGDNAVVLRTRIKTVPGKQWAIGRAYNGYLKTVFDERGIEIPFPQQTIWLGEAKDGSTQRFRIEDASKAADAGAQSSFGTKTEQNKTKPKENDTEGSEDDSTSG
ncbi:mechanosensitive ion channel domain-containing protein [Sulfitobacter sp. SK011]|uniref:mechanosensitive ion channel domain-containing protein n=1 Tax=Sulfitobacter sp. SK011 TaxID=1389004 RepID=UPI000E0ACC28|nr:mechanosensitive ion channel domain-containing protein [Sulfitobacter sp. SK011]AXI44250.1 mechanosensitive ion channel protein MscS [Sulfitobacter sp. SK011]